ncbi:hypothetical protein PIROE2DRAFT_56886 [Piromyces sp. E2]|nr:hypothetical protein PIROE2DRAFT_56886 [Piromyces sp. E2]|eukprot:OUM70197.1 hypothetical protein PIROE2DRAFT_56886 [Piromyces sp. E2]
MENLEEKKIDDILKDIHNDFIDYFDNIDIPKEGSTSFHDLNNKKSIYELENDFHQSINLVRESLTKFKDICLSGEKDKKKKDFTLRKLSLVLKDQNRNRQISKDWNSTCSDCLEALRQVCKIDKLQIMKKSLIDLADDLKLQYFCDSYPKGLCSEKISLYGKVIVIDVGLDKDGNAILIELAPESISKIKTIEVLLKNNLRENNIKKFYETLSNLAYLDKHSNEDYDLFHNIQCIENALTYIYENESKGRAIPDIIQYGHGYPLISVSRFGPSAIYWGSPSALRQINWSEFSRADDEEKATIMNLGFYKANITIINTKGYLEEFHVILEVYSPNAPNEITILFNHPSKPGIINVTITIPLDNPEENLKVQYNENNLLENDMKLPSGFGDMQDEKLRSEKLTQVLKLSYNIPLLIHYLMKCI